MVDYCITMFKSIFINVLQWFDTMMMDTGWIVWIGTVFLMIVGYRFIIRPLFGVFSLSMIGSGSSDSNKNFQRNNKKRDD